MGREHRRLAGQQFPPALDRGFQRVEGQLRRHLEWDERFPTLQMFVVSRMVNRRVLVAFEQNRVLRRDGRGDVSGMSDLSDRMMGTCPGYLRAAVGGGMMATLTT